VAPPLAGVPALAEPPLVLAPLLPGAPPKLDAPALGPPAEPGLPAPPPAMLGASEGLQATEALSNPGSSN